MSQDPLFAMAKAAMERSYSPYSKFPVGCAIRTTSGATFCGCNVENASYPEGTCAEAGAIAAMVMGGEATIQDIFVIGQADGLVTPCGGCRQRIREFSTPDTRVHVCGPEGVRGVMSFDELLPHSFGPEHLADSKDGQETP
ncbi:cytidine deaminase [Aliidiomarina halalkaliphila]|uniref:Cytidine deaminase n=1 Tax=Aliidiomarina halalkaliphila TaxID=2593535 RepID=A0A552X1M2_9GAMM|nr:cytidine deaminase [Aliidiomarina halalkaliphila]TRW48942.1 cytidine deaminase [Aliidiomarina halalkaliphila]